MPNSAQPPPESPRKTTRFALVSNGRSPHNDNHQRILAAADALKWETHIFDHGAVAMHAGTPVLVAESATAIADFDLVWVLGLGAQHDFLDRAQILTNLPTAKMVNTAEGMLALHAKHAQLPHSPTAFSGNNANWLCEAAAAHPDIARWVVKPSAGSYGRGVRVAESAQELLELLLQATQGETYCVVQEFVESIALGETRTLVLNQQIIGSYLRIPSNDYLANLSHGARAARVELTADQQQQVADVAAVLHAQGIRFAAIDMAFPYLIEVNVANPGGLATLASLNTDTTDPYAQRFQRALASMVC